eukprot:12419904-Karenia_brevis.AAC.1
MKNTGLDSPPGDGDATQGDTYQILREHFAGFFLECVEQGFDEDRLRELHRSMPLECVATKVSSAAFRRVSVCTGLPPDGHALHTVIQGKTIYFHFGKDRQVRLVAIKETDSDWQLHAHRGAVFLMAPSGSNKDAIIAISKACDKVCSQHEDLAESECLNALTTGHPTRLGLLAALKKGQTAQGTCNLMWYNSEVKAAIGVKENSVKEEDFCQIAEGTEVGKRTEKEEVCVRPNVWFTIAGPLDIFVERVGSADNGRLRVFSELLDTLQCVKVDFVDKFLKRSASFQ